MNPFVSSAVTKLWKPGGYWLGSGWRCSGCAHVVAEESGDCPFCKKSFVEPEYAAEE
jgi:rubrerythrin